MQGLTIFPKTPSFESVALIGGGKHSLEGWPPYPDKQTPTGCKQAKEKQNKTKKISKKSAEIEGMDFIALYQQSDSPRSLANWRCHPLSRHNRLLKIQENSTVSNNIDQQKKKRHKYFESMLG